MFEKMLMDHVVEGWKWLKRTMMLLTILEMVGTRTMNVARIVLLLRLMVVTVVDTAMELTRTCHVESPEMFSFVR